MNAKRRRIDTVLDPGYLDDIDEIDLTELRSRRDTAEEVEMEISYYRRLLHGRMDLLDFELRRRRGEEDRTLLEALPDILAGGLVLGGEPAMRHIETMPPIPEKTGRRLIDKVMDDGILTHLPDLGDDDVAEALERLGEIEGELSEQRRSLHAVIDAIHDEIVARYRSEQGEATVSN